FHRGAGDAGGLESNAGRDRAGPKRGVDVAIGGRVGAGEVVVHVRVHERRAVSRSGDDVAGPWQRIEVGDDLLGGVARLVLGLCDDNRERIADVVDLVAV